MYLSVYLFTYLYLPIAKSYPSIYLSIDWSMCKYLVCVYDLPLPRQVDVSFAN